MEIVTGYRGQAHITAAQTGAFNAGMFGQGEYVMENGEQLSAAIITNNLIRISDGDIVMQGRHITIAKGAYEEVQIANGLAGMNRNDLIVVRYSKDSTTGIEDARLLVIQGVSTEGAAQDPEYQQGDILAGDLEADMPLYRIRLSGLNVEEPECLFEKQDSLHSITKALLDIIHPVGAIYMSVNPTNPGSLFGGTWVAWGAGKVPVGVNTADTNFNTVEKTGGSSTETLTTDQLPKHTHSVGAHSHGLNNHTHGIPALSGTAASNGAHCHIMYRYSNELFHQAGNIGNYNMLAGLSGTTVSQVSDSSKGNKITEADGTHGHTVTTTASTSNAATGSTANSTAFNSGSAGSDNAHNNLQPYVTCYMWKRIS